VTPVPPSVAACGALARSQALSAPWFAPAGFNRGGLTNLGGNAGPSVLSVVETMNKANRDDLYELDINPIARLQGEFVIFGQKTLQQTPSALDRINVRRMMIYLKKRIGRIANTILFDQNIQVTWNKFKSRAERVLNRIKARGGITEFKVILDSSTTTPDLQDRNILYAKIYVKPAKAIEFIAVDFVITRSGVQF
jgi:phage tail sheath protein FI